MAIIYSEDTRAGKAGQEVERCAGELGIDPGAVATVVCEYDGTYRLTTSRRPGATGHWCEFWGEMLGAVIERGASLDLDLKFRLGVEASLLPASSALFVVVSATARERLLDTLSPFEGEAFVCRIPDRTAAHG